MFVYTIQDNIQWVRSLIASIKQCIAILWTYETELCL